MPGGTVVLQPPPEVPRGGGDGHWALNLLPMVAGLGSVVFFFVPGANALMMIVGGLTFASSLVFGAVTTVRQRNGGKGKPGRRPARLPEAPRAHPLGGGDGDAGPEDGRALRESGSGHAVEPDRAARTAVGAAAVRSGLPDGAGRPRHGAARDAARAAGDGSDAGAGADVRGRLAPPAGRPRHAAGSAGRDPAPVDRTARGERRAGPVGGVRAAGAARDVPLPRRPQDLRGRGQRPDPALGLAQVAAARPAPERAGRRRAAADDLRRPDGRRGGAGGTAGANGRGSRRSSS